jgi:mannose-6-phosphate isomerase
MELGKPLGEGNDFAESWELCDHGADQSIVEAGAMRGWPLERLVREHGAELLGRHDGLTQFPLLFKFLDASDRLSVQVHPNDDQAARHTPGERGKTEAWVILDALPGSCVFAGLKPGVTREILESALRDGTVEGLLHRVSVQQGDCLFIPAGTVHAIGEGVLLAEVQQSSDLTFRLFDWNRIGPDGKPRTLHIAESLACTDFHSGPVDPVSPRSISRDPGHAVEELVRSPYFTIVRHAATRPFEILADDRCHVLMTLDGALRVAGQHGERVVGRGQTLLLPARGLPARLEPRPATTFLEVYWD